MISAPTASRLGRVTLSLDRLRIDYLPHNVPARSFSADRRISRLVESGKKAAKAVARSIWIDGIAFEQGCPVTSRVRLGDRDHSLKHPLPTIGPRHEEADDRPDGLRLVTLHDVAH